VAGAEITFRASAVSKCISGGCDIYILNSDGSGLTWLTNVSDARQPAWSPDGTRIAFSRNGVTTPSIQYVSTSGGEPVQLLSNARAPAWR
jgi:Tol biopolymer transport system component